MPWLTLREMLFVSRIGFVSPLPNPGAGGPPLASCPRPLIQHIRGYPAIWRISVFVNRVTKDPLKGFIC